MPIWPIAATDADYSFLDNHCSPASNCCSSAVGLTVAQGVLESDPGYPPAGEKGMTVERISNRLGAAGALRAARLVTGIIGGIAVGAPECPVGIGLAHGIAPAGVVDVAAPAQLAGTDSGPTEVD
jgi:hypothetical protein